MTTVSSGQSWSVSSGQTDNGDIVLAGGTLDVLSGGRAIDTTVFSQYFLNGEVIVESGGSITGTTLNSGGYVDVLSGGTAVDTTVSGIQYTQNSIVAVESGGTVIGTTINSGGLENDLGTASGTTVNRGGYEYIYGTANSTTGTASGTTVNSGGEQVIEGPGATAISTTVHGGGVQDDWGVASAAMLNGGYQIVEAGGSAISTTVNRGGHEVVSSGGTAIGTTVNSGGTLELFGGADADLFGTTVIAAGGSLVIEDGYTLTGFQVASGVTLDDLATTSATTINSGGVEVVSSGGMAISTTIDGGLMEIAKGGSTGSAPISFTTAGGELQLDASQSFHGVIAGFGSPSGVTEEIDLRDIAFGKSTHLKFKEAKDNLSGTLTIQEGSHIATLTLLGQYSAANFSLSSDGHGGTIVTDPTPSASQHGPSLVSHT